MKIFLAFALSVFAVAAGVPNAVAQTTIYPAAKIVTMARPGGAARAVAVRDGRVAGLGGVSELRRRFPDANIDATFAGKTILPGLIDPHVHVMLGGLLYAQPFAPPWPMATPEGQTEGYPTRAAFLARLSEIVRAAPDDGSPVIVYGYHNLIQGDLDRSVLDSITTARPLVIWHYSGHDFYFNSKGLEAIDATPALAQRFHGVDLSPAGQLTGRLYEDAGFYVFGKLGDALASPAVVARGAQRYFRIMRNAGVTTTADLAYGVFGIAAEDQMIARSWSLQANAFRMYLVPEFRALERQFGGGAAAASAVRDMVEGRRRTAAPVLPRVKFFTDGAFYSQTMRLAAPGYLAGQTKGGEGLWVTEPGRIADVIRPYMQAGLAAHIHSNGDAAQTATLAALETLRTAGETEDLVIEHGALFTEAHVADAARLRAKVSAASHYAYYLGHGYAEALGEGRSSRITPLGDLGRAGVTVALHSDAPLAPPQPLRAASVQALRSTREGRPYANRQALSRYDALEAVTLDAARVLGLDAEIGSIEIGKRADFTILDRNPLEAHPATWPSIGVWGVVLDGAKRPLSE